MPSFARVTALTLLFAFFTFASPLAAKEPPAPEDEPVVEKDKDKEKEKPWREQTIYIPYNKLRGVFEKDGRGVFLPYEKFQELWQKARERDKTAVDEKPPVGALVTAIDSEATVAEDVVNVSAKLTVELLAAGWHRVPLRLADAAIRSAKIGQEAARVVYEPKAGYLLLVEKKSKEPQQIELTVEYAKAFTKAPGQNSVSFQAPQAPVNRWQIRIPGAGAKVNVQPLLAATQPPIEGQPKEAAKETIVLAFVGAAPMVRLDWTPKAEGAAGLEALANVQAEHEITLDEGALRARTRLAYKISRAELTQLVIEVPKEFKVVNVFDANVQKWNVEEKGAVQQITVQLFEPAKDTQNVTVELEKFIADLAKEPLVVPSVKALNVGRQQGVVTVRVAPELRAEIKTRTGLLQVDVAELPAALAATKWDFSYRYAALPFELSLRAEKVQPRIRTEELAEAYLEPDKLTIDLLAIYHVERAGVFQLELDLPPGLDVRLVEGRAAAGAEAVAVDAHHLTGENKTRLVVNLARKALGNVALWVELEKRLDDDNLRRPTGSKSKYDLAWPRVVSTGIERQDGRLIVYAPESLQFTPGELTGLRRISVAEALLQVESLRAGRFPTTREVLAFATTKDAKPLPLEIERRKPHVAVRQMLRVKIESGVVKYQAAFHYDIRYSGVKELRLDVPKSLVKELHNDTHAYQYTTLDPAPKDLPDGYVAWGFTGDGELLDSHVIRLSWEQKISELEVGKTAQLKIPRLRPMGANREKADLDWGQIVLAKAEAMDVRPDQPTGLRPIDPQHDLQPGIDASDAARAFEFHDDWSLAVEVTRYKLEEVKTTSIEQAVVRMVVTKSNKVAVQAVYRMRSARQRLALKLPANVQLDSTPLRINGHRVDLESGDANKKDLFHVPLVGQNPETPFLVELRYEVDGQRRLDLPEFPEEPAVQKVNLCVYVPQERVLLGSLGNWTKDTNYSPDEYIVPVPPYHADQLLATITRDIGVAVSPTFQTDGHLFIFSTLRPAAGRAGSLSLVTMNETWLKFLIFVAIAAGGLSLVKRPMSNKLTAVAGLVIALVTLGVFWPTFSAQVVNWVLFTAIGLVLLAWFLVWFIPFAERVRVRRAERAAARAAARAATPQPTPTASPPSSPFADSASSTPGATPGNGGPSHE